MLSIYIYICEGIYALRIYVAITSPYPWDRGVIGWYKSLGSDFQYISRQINVILICNWRARVLTIHSNYKYEVIYSFLIVHSLKHEIFHLFIFQFFFPVIFSLNLEFLLFFHFSVPPFCIFSLFSSFFMIPFNQLRHRKIGKA